MGFSQSQIMVCETLQSADSCAKALLANMPDGQKLLGFDIEWEPYGAMFSLIFQSFVGCLLSYDGCSIETEQLLTRNHGTPDRSWLREQPARGDRAHGEAPRRPPAAIH